MVVPVVASPNFAASNVHTQQFDMPPIEEFDVSIQAVFHGRNFYTHSPVAVL